MWFVAETLKTKKNVLLLLLQLKLIGAKATKNLCILQSHLK